MNAKDQPITAPLINFQIEDIVPILIKRRNVVFLFFTVVVVFTLIFGLLRTKEYRATSLIHLSPRAGQEVANNEVVDYNTRGYFEIQQFFRTQIQIIRSRSVREAVVQAYNDLGYDDLLLEDGGANQLYSMMGVVPEEQSQLVQVSITHTDPERAAVLANLVARIYSAQNLEGRQDASSNATAWLESQLADYEAKVATAHQAMHAFKADTQLVDVEERLTTLTARMDSLNQAYGTKTTDLVLLQTTLASHEELLKRGAWEDLAKVLPSALLDASAQAYATAAARDADLATRYGPSHPERVQSAARMDALQEAMRTEISRLIDGERARLAVLTQTVQSLDAEIDGVKQDMLVYQRKVTDYDTLKAETRRLEGFYEKLSMRLQEVSLASRTQLNNVAIVDEALPPTTPYKPNIPLSLGVASVVGVIFGMLLALFREYADDTITSQADVTMHLKVPFLGLVPRLPDGVTGHEADLFTHYNPRSSVSEAVRGLRAMIEMNPSGPSPRRLLVTSSVAREGKTSTSLRMAVSFAQMGRKVVLIDADLRRPRVHKVFGADNDVGLSSFLVGAAEVDDLPNATPVPNLYAIYSGASTDHPAELMASDRMEALLKDLEDRFDIIILDTPPSVALSDAVILSRRVDGVLLVVKEQSVSRSVVKQTIDLMRQVDANLYGVVLNNVDLQRAGSKYKYYYAYRDYYANYQFDGQPEDSDKAAK